VAIKVESEIGGQSFSLEAGKLADVLTRGLGRVCLAWHPTFQTRRGG